MTDIKKLGKRVSLSRHKAALDDLREVTMRNAEFRRLMIAAIHDRGEFQWRGRRLLITDAETGLPSHETSFDPD